MTSSALRVAAQAAIVLLFLALRLPLLASSDPLPEELGVIGAGHHFAVTRDTQTEPLATHTPLPLLATSLPLALLETPAAEWDEDGPPTQIAWRTLRETRLPGFRRSLPPRWVAIVSRLPVLLAGLIGLVLIERLGARFYGRGCGLLAGGAWAAHPMLARAESLAVADGVAVAALTGLLAAAAAYSDTIAAPIRPSRRLARTRLATLGVTAGLAVAAAPTLLPVVLACAVWLHARRRALAARGERIPGGATGRGLVIALLAGFVLWAGYQYEVGQLRGLTVPAPTYARALVGAVREGSDTALADAARAFAVAGSLGLGALGLLGLVRLRALHADRVDLPALFATCLAVPLLAWAICALPPRLAAQCGLLALPSAFLLGSAALVRIARRRRVPAVALGLVAAASLAAGWPLRPPADAAEPAIADRAPLPHSATGEERWMLEQWLAAEQPARVTLVIGRTRGLEVSDTVRIDRYERPEDVPEPVPSGHYVLAEWLHEQAPPAIRTRDPDDRLGRLLLYEIR